MTINRTKLFFKRGIKSVAAAAGAGRGRSARLAGAVNILAYHRVAADIHKAESEAYYGLVVSAATFRRHCEMLKNAFDVVTLEEAANGLKDHRRTRPMAVITFDDGYLDFYEQAYPILKSLGLPATVFLPTEYIGSGQLLDHDRLYWLLKLADEQNVNVSVALARAGVPERAAR